MMVPGKEKKKHMIPSTTKNPGKIHKVSKDKHQTTSMDH